MTLLPVEAAYRLAERSWSLQKVSQLMRMFVALGEIRPLVSLVTDELFHEMSIMPEIASFLETAVADDTTAPADRRSNRCLRRR
jgi:hypothetical protein